MRHAFKNFLFIVLTYTSCLAVVCADECKGTVYLTFDTSNMAQAEEIARTLNTEWVKATFFIANEKTVRGDYALGAGWADFWRARVAEGHAFGIHTWDHLYLRRAGAPPSRPYAGRRIAVTRYTSAGAKPDLSTMNFPAILILTPHCD